MSDIYKRIKRNLSRSKQLEYGGKIAFFIPSIYLAYGLFALNVIQSIEKKYNSEIHVILEDCDSAKFIKNKEDEKLKIYVVHIQEKIKEVLREEVSIGWWRKYRAIVASSATKLGFKSLLVPVCAEAISKMEISSILLSKLDGGGEGELNITRPDGFSFVNVFYGISCREIAFLSYKLHPEAFDEQGKAELKMKKTLIDEYASNIIMSSIKWRSGEVLHSIDKSISWLLGSAIVSRCQYCGGFSLRKGVCSYCEVFNEEKMNEILYQSELIKC